ncbi:MAG: PAS domain-containing protein, partial [Hymenobacter sp.]
MSAPGSLLGIEAPTNSDQLAYLAHEVQQARAEAALAHQHLAALTNYLREGLLLLNAELRVLLINDQFCRLLGVPLPASQWLGVPMQQLADKVQELVADPAAYAAEIATGPVGGAANTLLHLQDGRTLERDMRPVTLGEAAGWLLSYRDVTAHRQTESQRDAQRKFYETILDEVPVEIAVLDEQ